MKQRTTPKRRLLALNLALVLLCSLILPVSAGAAGSNIVIGKGSGTVDHSGPGWVYDASERTLTLDNYQGGYIDVTTGGNLTIYANGNVVIDNESTYHSAIQLWSDDSLDLVVNGTLTINSKSANGIVANGDVTVRSNSLVWTGPDGKTYYDGKGSSLLTINAGRYGIRGNDVSMDVNGEVKGTSGAVRSNGSVRFGSQDGTSALNATLTAAQNAAAVVYNRNGTASVGEHMDSDFARYGNTPYQLTLYPKTYTTTLNGDGGTCNGQGTVTVAQAYPAHVKLGDYAFTKPGYTLTGFSLNGQTVAANYEFIPSGDTTVTAQWTLASKNDVSDKITFAQAQDTAVYAGPVALNTFVSEASIANITPAAAFTYTLTKDGGSAQTVALTDTVSNAGTYTITACYEDEENLGTVSRTFTITPAPLTASATVAEKTYDGTTAAEATVSFAGLVNGESLTAGTDYTVSAAFADANAGASKSVAVSVELLSTAATANYTLTNGQIAATGTIAKAAAKTIPGQTLYVNYQDTARKSATVAGFVPDTNDYYVFEAVDDNALLGEAFAVDAGGQVTFALKDGLTEADTGKQASAVIRIGSVNYEDSYADLDVNVVYEYVPVVEVEDLTATYTGSPISGSLLRGTAMYDGQEVPGTWSFKDGQALTNVADSGVKIAVFTPDDLDTYSPVEVLVNVTIVEREEPRPSGGGSSGSSYSISVDSGSHGSLTVSPRNASKGDKVTITVNPDDGYVLKDLTATASNGDEIELTKRADGRYTFTMPAGSVKVKATWAIGTETVAGFRDVPSDAYYADAVAWAAEEEITGGITATTFGPNNGCTRSQVVTFLWRAAGSPVVNMVNPFTDVSEDAYNYQAILWAYASGITGGMTETTFAPNATCTRAQIVTFLHRAQGSPAAHSSVSFTDVPADAYYADAVAWAAEEGITGGVTATTFAPNATCTRAQVVTFLYRDMAE